MERVCERETVTQCLKAGFHTYEAYGRAAGQGIFLTFDSNSEYTFTAQTQVKLQDRVDSWQTLPKKTPLQGAKYSKQRWENISKFVRSEDL